MSTSDALSGRLPVARSRTFQNHSYGLSERVDKHGRTSQLKHTGDLDPQFFCQWCNIMGRRRQLSPDFKTWIWPFDKQLVVKSSLLFSVIQILVTASFLPYTIASRQNFFKNLSARCLSVNIRVFG